MNCWKCFQNQGSEEDKWRWDDYKVTEDFHNGEIEWLSHDSLTGYKQKQYYQVQESEIRENDWLNLYTEFAFHSKFNSSAPLKIKKVVVQTREDVESSKKLKSGNAVFYISFAGSDETQEHRAVIRRVTDGIQGHVALEVKVNFGDLS
ncbi:unnamed protein product [Thlaspi arvense]|uniref:Uncharacterized protein n=1 Tax=Thlaspi arvense TaxID=13288 RepID=A0AAU9T5B9_THLAR|nr:unnamed protein product [Thlaspi arvense]